MSHFHKKRLCVSSCHVGSYRLLKVISKRCWDLNTYLCQNTKIPLYFNELTVKAAHVEQCSSFVGTRKTEHVCKPQAPNQGSKVLYLFKKCVYKTTNALQGPNIKVFILYQCSNIQQKPVGFLNKIIFFLFHKDFFFCVVFVLVKCPDFS